MSAKLLVQIYQLHRSFYDMVLKLTPDEPSLLHEISRIDQRLAELDRAQPTIEQLHVWASNLQPWLAQS